jgi:hypothetical protein
MFLPLPHWLYCSDVAHITIDGDVKMHAFCVALGNQSWEDARKNNWFEVVALLPVYPKEIPASERRKRIRRTLNFVMASLKTAGALPRRVCADTCEYVF